MEAISTERLIEDIVAWASIETPTDMPEHVNALMSRVATAHEQAGMDVTRIEGTGDRGDKLVAKAPWGRRDEAGVLVISHLDTVHPVGTLRDFPVRRVGGRIEGPGVFDMKAGACMALEASRSILRAGETPRLPLTFLYVPDEEMGSQTSREIIEDLGRRARYVLVAEGTEDTGAVVTSRIGSLKFDLDITGVAAHSGGNHREGRSALRELAHQIIALEEMTDYDRGITVNVGTASGGTRANVVPERAKARVDIRVTNPRDADEMRERIAQLAPRGADVDVAYSGGIWRMPYVRTPAIAGLFETATKLASSIGLELTDTRGLGGSDASLVAAFAPVLDGLGPLGGGAHTRQEWIDLDSLRPRTALLARLMATLE